MLLNAQFWTCATTLLCLCPTILGVENGPSHNRVVVKEGSDVVLRCSSGNQDLTSTLFDWRKEVPNGRQEVFFYDSGDHYNNGRGGQDPQFKGRVSHFEDELQHGNASIKIHNTKMEDSGDYTCYFPRLLPDQIFRVQLVVDGILKDRSGSPGVAPAPDIKTVKATNDWWQLQCDVRGASTKPTVEWKNSDGKVLHSQEPEVTESEGRFDVTLLITVNQTGLYRCVVTQEELHHQTHAETFVSISGAPPTPHIKTVNATDAWSLLQCDVRGASPKPTVEWKNSDGEVLHSQEPEVRESEGRYNVTVLTTVFRTGLYRCVVTQEDQVHAETSICISGSENPCSEWSLISGFVGILIGCSAFAFAVALIIFVAPQKIVAFVKRFRPAGLKVVTVFVEEGSDAVLRCFLRNQDLKSVIFDWRKVDHKDLKKVFLYDAGKIYNNGHSGQDPQFKGRVSHFGDELQRGNASIKIHETTVEDSGNYTCCFPFLCPPQSFRVELVVGASNGRLLNSSPPEV